MCDTLYVSYMSHSFLFSTLVYFTVVLSSSTHHIFKYNVFFPSVVPLGPTRSHLVMSSFLSFFCQRSQLVPLGHMIISVILLSSIYIFRTRIPHRVTLHQEMRTHQNKLFFFSVVPLGPTWSRHDLCQSFVIRVCFLYSYTSPCHSPSSTSPASICTHLLQALSHR